MKGRPPNPPGLTALCGSRPGGGRKKHVHIMAPLVEPPPDLTGPERELFCEILQNAPSGLLAQIDATLLGVFCQHWAIHRRATKELEALTIETSSGQLKPHPLVTIAGDSAKLLILLSEALGIGALARSRIKLPPAPDGWADIAHRPLG